MNFREYFNLNESPIFDDNPKDLSKKSLESHEKDETRYASTKKNGYLLETKKFNEYTLELWKITNPSLYRIFVFYDFEDIGVKKEIVGYLGISRQAYLPFPQVMASYVYDDYQGQGIGKAMYRMAIDELDGLISDDSLTGETGGGSFHMWQSLAKEYNPYLLIWDEKRRGVRVQKVPQFTKDMMNSGDEWFLVTKKPRQDESNTISNKLDETPVFDDSSKSLSRKNPERIDKDITRYKSTKRISNLLEINKFGEYTLELWKVKGYNFYRIFALLNNEVIGYLGIRPSGDILPFPQVQEVYVYEDYQGQGIGKAMYRMTIEKLEGLVSDKSLTGESGSGSFHIWQSLAKEYNPYLLNWNGTTHQFNIEKIHQFTKEMMKTHDSSLFLVTKKPRQEDN